MVAYLVSDHLIGFEEDWKIMHSINRFRKYLVGPMVIVLTVFLASCSTPRPRVDTTAPQVTATIPVADATGVPTNVRIVVTFDEPMDADSLTSSDFTVTGPAATPVAGVVSYDPDTTSVWFTPTTALDVSTRYTATLTSGITDKAGNAWAGGVAWSFTTASAVTSIQPIDLGMASGFVILAQTKVSTTGTTEVVGDVGISPAARSFITGFADSLDASGTFATSSIVTGRIYAANMADPTPAMMTTTISDMETAYTDAAGRTSPDFTELGAGDVSGLTLVPGLYKWGTGVLISTNLTLSGSADDVWVFQIAENLTVANGAQVTLVGGARPENIFWQIAGQATLGTGSTVQGILLTKTQIVLETGATLNGRALAQTAVTLDANAVTQPSN